jgi:hypothetical protein
MIPAVVAPKQEGVQDSLPFRVPRTWEIGRSQKGTRFPKCGKLSPVVTGTPLAMLSLRGQGTNGLGNNGENLAAACDEQVAGNKSRTYQPQ